MLVNDATFRLDIFEEQEVLTAILEHEHAQGCEPPPPPPWHRHYA